uniref:Odorant-binding protein 16 n=1 Tax=Cnaphalocrocis medinalis TaxID=437488 RepID=A0A0U2SQT3_CNAME|nr:odorant-binding protein 16 [Cnaphalocrocis medinalis]
MAKFICLFVCVAVISSAYGVSQEEKEKFHEAIMPLLVECSEAHGVSKDDIKNAKEAGTAQGLNSCFIGCVMKKAGIIDAKGQFDVDAGVEKIKKYIANADEVAKFEEVGKTCASVNEKPVTDGEAGCDRAKLLLDCIREHKSEIPL